MNLSLSDGPELDSYLSMKLIGSAMKESAKMVQNLLTHRDYSPAVDSQSNFVISGVGN